MLKNIKSYSEIIILQNDQLNVTFDTNKKLTKS